MLKAILFDLDNTLILFDEDIFYAGFIQRISRVFADIMPAEEFTERLITTIRSLKKNNGQISNKDYFVAGFSRGYEDRLDVLWQRFQYFYEKEYDKLKVNVSLPNSLHDVFNELLHGRFTLVLASNPLFPENVQMKRLAWAGLEHVPFTLVTHIENMTFCKPRLEYYLEICAKIRVAPENCLMVGNDPINDMIAARVGMKTYLTDDSKGCGRVKADNSGLLRKLKLTDFPLPDFEGPLSKLPETVSNFTKP